MICLPLISWQTFSRSFATLLILVKDLDIAALQNVLLLTDFLIWMKVNNWVS